MAENKIGSIVARRYRKMRELNQDVADRVEINRNLYGSKIDVDENYEWDYSLTDPHVFPIVRNYLSRSNPANISIRLDNRKPDGLETRQVNQDLVNWELGELATTSLFYRIYYSGYVAGHGYADDGWLNKPAVQVKGKDGRIIQISNITNRYDARFKRFNDILIPNRNILIIYDQPYYIELKQMTIGELEDYNKAVGTEYFDESWIKKLKDSGEKGLLLDYQMEYVKDDEKEKLAVRAATISMMCMHTKDNEIFYVPLKEERVVNNITENPYWHGHYPIIDFTPFPEDDEYYSMGIVDVVGDLQIAATEVLNQNMTNIRQVNNDMWVAGSDAAQTPDWAFQKRPSGIIRVAGDASQVQQIRTQDNTMSGLHYGQDIQNKIERASGISSLYASGAAGTNVNQTARGAQIIDQNIDFNMRMIIDLFGEQVIKTMGEHALELNAQYITEEQTFSVTGKKGVKELVSIRPDQISANFNVSVNSERMVKQTPASRQASLQNFITQLSNIKQQNQELQIDLIPVVDALADSYPEMDNVEDIVVSLDEKSKRDIAMLERGQEVEVKVRDPHKDLLMVAKIHYEDNAQNYPEEVSAVFGKYFVDHTRYIQAAQEVQAMSQPTIPQPTNPADLQAEMQNPQAGLPDQGYNLGQIAQSQGA